MGGKESLLTTSIITAALSDRVVNSTLQLSSQGARWLLRNSQQAASAVAVFQSLSTIRGSGGLANLALNGLRIQDFQVPDELNDYETFTIDTSDIITDYYEYTTSTSHAFVIFRTENGNVYMCHLVGEHSNSDNSPALYVQVRKLNSSHWQPRNIPVRQPGRE
ncbi:unnamed protein product, partial [Rotaria magnacalcarata]